MSLRACVDVLEKATLLPVVGFELRFLERSASSLLTILITLLKEYI